MGQFSHNALTIYTLKYQPWTWKLVIPNFRRGETACLDKHSFNQVCHRLQALQKPQKSYITHPFAATCLHLSSFICDFYVTSI